MMEGTIPPAIHVPISAPIEIRINTASKPSCHDVLLRLTKLLHYFNRKPLFNGSSLSKTN